MTIVRPLIHVYDGAVIGANLNEPVTVHLSPIGPGTWKVILIFAKPELGSLTTNLKDIDDESSAFGSLALTALANKLQAQITHQLTHTGIVRFSNEGTWRHTTFR